MAMIANLLHQHPWPTVLAGFALLVGVLTLAAAVLRGLFMAMEMICCALAHWVEIASRRLAHLIYAGVEAVACAMLALLCWPFQGLWAVTGRALVQKRAARLERARGRQAREQELRRLWRECGRQFSTFEAFQRAFETGAWRQQQDKQDGSRERPPAPDAFAEACRLLGLPADGRFSREDLNARYRSLIHRLHGDRGGSDVLAAQVNTARDAIIKRKGWK